VTRGNRAAVWNLVRRSAYHDSVTLMRLSSDMERAPGVRRVAAMMGTPANLALLREAGLLGPEGEEAGPTDLVFAVIADTEDVAAAAWRSADAALARPRSTVQTGARPRTLRSALDELPSASLALISVPGAYAGVEAMKALAAGLHVMLFSDNVPIETEVRLKRAARERGLLCMGPDCGTAILGGVPLGFANAVPRGRIGVVAASGTGLQAVTCHVAAAGEGISHAIGLGGRDLSDEVGGLMLEPALEALAADDATAVVCLVSKPPGPATARRAHGWLERLGKPSLVHFVGGAAGSTSATLEDAALAAVAMARGERPTPATFSLAAGEVERLVGEASGSLALSRRFVRGVYAGGTLAGEALHLLRERIEGVASRPGTIDGGHRVTDLGDDRFTLGRPHPMIDGAVRREWIAREAADTATAVILLDVVLGHGAHPDPAGELLPAIEGARAGGVAVIASVCGTADDPQGLVGQVAALRRAGVIVMSSNAQAARLAALVASRQAR
jgi:FdrA protein